MLDGIALLRADYDAQAGRSLSLPIAGSVWAAVGVAGLILPDRPATLFLLFATGAMLPVALVLARALGERLLGNTNPLATLMGLSTLMVNLLWVLHITVALEAPAFVPLTIGIGLGLHWVVFTWVIGHRVGVVHAIARTILVGAAWWLFPDSRIAVAGAVIVAYVYSIVTLARRVPNRVDFSGSRSRSASPHPARGGYHLAPPERAIVLSVDEKTQIQALDRTQPMVPMKPGPGRPAHPRLSANGTLSLFAALETTEFDAIRRDKLERRLGMDPSSMVPRV